MFSECDFLKTLEENLNNSNLGKNKLDPEEDFLHFLNTFLNCLEIHAPTQKLTRKETKLYFKPWLTKSIQDSIKKKTNYINYLPNMLILNHITKNTNNITTY